MPRSRQHSGRRHLDSRNQGFVHARTIVSGHRTEGDVQAIPCVDVGYGKREIDQLLLGEVRPHELVHVIRNVTLGNVRHRFGPRERLWRKSLQPILVTPGDLVR